MWAYVLVAIAGFISGMAMGRLGFIRDTGSSQAAPPSRPSNPRSLQP